VSTVAVPGPSTGTNGVVSLPSTGPAVNAKVEVLDSVGKLLSSKTVGVRASSTATYQLAPSATGGTVVVTAPQADAVVVARSLTSAAKGRTPQLTVLQPAPPQIESGRSALVRTLR